MLNRPLSLLLVVALGLGLVWHQRGNVPQETARTALIMGTLIEIKAFGSDEKKAETAIDDAFSVMREVEAEFSPHLPDSSVAHLNRSMEARQVSPRMLELLRLGNRIHEQSHGAFSMALGGIKDLWAIEEEEPRVPTADQLAKTLPPPEQSAVDVEGDRVRRTSQRVQLDLGGIAKGFAVDLALGVLRESGITSASVNAGGDIRVLGDHGERPWRIGIQHPRAAGKLLATIEVRDRAIVTSGDYERYFEREGVRYHHIFDPHSGRPASGCQSVSVLAPGAALADALATAAFVLGPEAGLQLLEETPEVEGLIISAHGEHVETSGLRGRLAWR